MIIYDKVKINNNDNSIIYNDLINLLKENHIKVVNTDNSLTERSILNIDIKDNGIIIDNKEIDIKDLFKKYKFVPNIFTDNIEYIKRYSNMIIKKKKLSDKLLNKYKYHSNFNKVNGSVYISDEEYYLLNNTKLKKYIFTCNNNKYKYVIPTDDGYMLRGANTYYYLLSNKGKYDHVLYKHFKELHDNYIEYFNGLLTNITDDEERILILSILDNIRNYLLIIINLYSIMNQDEDETLLFEFDNKYILDITYEVYKEMINILENDKYDLDNIKDILNKIININYLDDVKITNNILYDKMLKSHRECDNFLENYICIKEYYKEKNNEKYYLSLLYGGIEIPLIFYYLSNKKSKVLYITLFGIYKERHNKILSYDDKRFIINNKTESNINEVVLCDDNMLTGKTLQYVIDSLCMINIKVKSILLINYVALNRMYQILNNKTLLDTDLVDKYIYGLYYPTKYSKIKFNINICNSYLDEYGLFDISKEYICYYLYKNGIYSMESRINKYRIEGII